MEEDLMQSARDNVIQIQKIYYGMSEEKAKELYEEQGKLTIAACSEVAKAIAEQRIAAFEKDALLRIGQIEKDYQSFSDPSFQVLLRKAQLTAACTERESDYNLLSELLVHRIKNRQNVKKKASITKAVEIIDQIDEDALNALTVFLSMRTFTPTSGEITEGIRRIEELYEKLNLDMLPNDFEWMDNLSILGAIRVGTIGRLKKYEDYFASCLSGYVCVGIKKDSEDYSKAIQMLNDCNLPSSIMIDHELMDGYVRLLIPKKESIEDIRLYSKQGDLGGIEVQEVIPLNDSEKETLVCIFEMYTKDQALLDQVKTNFVALLNSFPAIQRAINWWDSISQAIELTSIGRVIGHTNARRMDSGLPDLD